MVFKEVSKHSMKEEAMSNEPSVADHYSHGRLIDVILAGVQELGKTPDSVTVDDLAAVDEFHIGGRRATADLIGQLDLASDQHVLDVGLRTGRNGPFSR